MRKVVNTMFSGILTREDASFACRANQCRDIGTGENNATPPKEIDIWRLDNLVANYAKAVETLII